MPSPRPLPAAALPLHAAAMPALLASSLLAISLLVPSARAQSVGDLLKQRLPEALRPALVLTTEDEIRTGQAAAANLLGVAPLVQDDGLQRYVNTVGRWIAMGSERPDLPWRFGVIDSADVNAFAAPGGYVLITRGLYASLGDEGELAGVLGHEISHVVERHHLELMRKTVLLDMGVQALQKQVKGDHDALVRRLVGTGAEMFARRLDQGAEFQADRNGMILAARAGYSPFGLPAVLQKIASLAPTDDRVTLLYQTHPAPEQRLRQLESAFSADLYRYDRPDAGGKLYPLR